MVIKKILVPIDGSECSQKALEYALDLAEKYSAEIKLLTVTEHVVLVEPIFLAASIFDTQSQIEIEKNIEKAYKNILDEALRKSIHDYPNLKIEKQLLKGRPADEIVEFAETENFDMIIMGNRGLSRIKDFFLGSVSNRVVDKAKCPVLIVKI